MPRCAPARRAWLGLALAAIAALAAPAQAQSQAPRNFPAKALRGLLVVGQPPEISLNGNPARLAPGATIRSAQNLLVMSGTLIGQPMVVNYTLDPLGLVLNVWILTDAERARLPWPTTPEQAAAWRFDPVEQTWSPQ